MRLAVLLFCCAIVFGQNTSSAPEAKSQAEIRGTELGALDVLSDTQGVDFGPYLKGILQTVRGNWYTLIPESVQMKKGKLAIEFAITKHGNVADMRLVAASGDIALDRPAWGSITASNPFPPLPNEFNRPYLALRLRFYYNPDEADLQDRSPRVPKDCPAASGVAVCIDAPADLWVPAGGSKIITASVGGTKEQAVDWTVECSSSACGKMTNDMYTAPIVRPNPPVVILTAISKADPTAKASVIVHLVRPASQVPAKP